MTLTRDQVVSLLQVAQAYDNRNLGTANVHAWHDAADRGRWGFEEAVNAIKAHYAESSEYLLPAHVTARIRWKQQEPPRAAEAIGELPAASPAQPERVRAYVDAVARKLGWQRVDTGAANLAATAVECPHCHARPGVPCTVARARGPHRGERVRLGKGDGTHPSRIELARAAADQEPVDLPPSSAAGARTDRP